MRGPVGVPRLRDAATGLMLPAWVVESRQTISRREETAVRSERGQASAVEQRPAAQLDEREEDVARELTNAGGPDTASASACNHLLFVASPDGYRVIERGGALPGERSELQLELGDDDRRYVVSRIGRSPIPHDERPCAFLEPAA